MKKLLPLLLALTLLLSACSIAFLSPQVDFADIEQQTYSSENGYSIQLPADWALSEETETTSSFISSDKALSLIIGSELGGIEYYSLEEIGDMLTGQLSSQLFSEAQAEPLALAPRSYRRTISGTNAAGEQISAELYISEPLTAIRYYLLFIMDEEQYQAMSKVRDGVIVSFSLDLDEDQLYQLMQTRAEARRQAQAESEAEQQALEEDMGTETIEQ